MNQSQASASSFVHRSSNEPTPCAAGRRQEQCYARSRRALTQVWRWFSPDLVFVGDRRRGTQSENHGASQLYESFTYAAPNPRSAHSQSREIGDTKVLEYRAYARISGDCVGPRGHELRASRPASPPRGLQRRFSTRIIEQRHSSSWHMRTGYEL